MSTETIAQVAIQYTDGRVFTLPRPARHGDLIKYMIDECGIPRPYSRGQGFLTSKGRFVEREEALIIALNANQCIRQTHPSMLFSEDLF